MLSFAGVLAALTLVMAVAWLWQLRTRNIGWVDVFWTFGTAAGGVALAIGWRNPASGDLRRLLVCALAALWALRLGLFVAIRVAKAEREDGRYQALREQWGRDLQPRLLGFLLLQAAVAAALAAAIGLAANRPSAVLGWQDLLGVAIALAAILGEGLADRQLQAFAADPQNRGEVCDRGLWAWSRHPNYLFEWLAWFAYPVMAIHVSSGHVQGWQALLAPLLMYLVLRFGTGVPPLEAHMLRTRGDAYRAYQGRVPAFLPFPRPPEQARS